MDAFEAARQKHAKNLERRLRATPHEPVEEVGRVEPEVQVPSEKPMKQQHEAIIELMVKLPDREIVVRLQKPHVYENTNKAQLNRVELKKCLEAGLRPLMGGLHDVPGGS
jgi:hypothetical protein